MPAYAQRSPSEALSPSAGPSWTARPPSAATSGSVPSYTAGARRPQSASEDFRTFTQGEDGGRPVGQWAAGGVLGPPGVASGSAPLAASDSL